jgi:hypothetical protein
MHAFLSVPTSKLCIVDSADEAATERHRSARGECKLVLNVYKTAKTTRQFVETLPSELAQVLRASVKAFPGLSSGGSARQAALR